MLQAQHGSRLDGCPEADAAVSPDSQIAAYMVSQIAMVFGEVRESQNLSKTLQPEHRHIPTSQSRDTPKSLEGHAPAGEAALWLARDLRSSRGLVADPKKMREAEWGGLAEFYGASYGT